MSSTILALPPELLEHVLRYLPMIDLVQVFNVCKEWRNVVLNSLHLKSTLFLVPKDLKRCLLWKRRTCSRPLSTPEWNTVSKKVTLRLVPATSLDRSTRATQWSGGQRRGRVHESRIHVCVFNDFFFDDLLPESRLPDIESMGNSNENIYFNKNFRALKASSSTSYWRSMYVSQPPATCVTISGTFRKPADKPTRRQRVPPHEIEHCAVEEITHDSGVTVGHILDKFQELESQLGPTFLWDPDILVPGPVFLTEDDISEIEAMNGGSDEDAERSGSDVSTESDLESPWTPINK